MRTISSILILIFILSMGYSSHADTSAWPMFRHDLQHTGRSPYTGPSSPVVAWTYQTGEAIASSVSLGDDGTIYVGSGYITAGRDSSLYALNRDGRLKWRFKVEGGIFSSPAIAPDGTIYVGSLDRYLYAIEDSVTYGRLKWRFRHLLPVYSSPTIAADGTIYIGGLDFNLYAVNPNGTEKWRYTTDWCVFSSPIIGPEGEVYVGSKDHNLYAFEDSVTYAKLRWKHAFGTFYDGHLVDSSPAMGPGGTLYVGVDPYGAAGQQPVPIDTAFYAVNADGTRRWSFVMEDGTESSPAIGPDGMIYIGSYDGNLYAIRDRGDAYTLEWSFSTGGAIDGSPTVDGCGTIYFGSRDSTIYALNPDGSLRWSYRTDGGIEASPTIDDNGILYIGSFDGKLYSIGSDGPDVGVDAIELPGEVTAGTSCVPQATVQNYRAGLQSFEVACLIDTAGVPVYGDTIDVENLEEITPLEVSFQPWIIGQDTGTVYNVTVVALLAGDGNAYNDTLRTVTRAIDDAMADAGDGGTMPPAHLGQCYPNPFNPSTTIAFGLSGRTHVSLRIYDVSGRLVRTLIDSMRGEGEHVERWNGTDGARRTVSSGVYFCRLEAGPFTETKKMVLLR